MTTIKLLAAMSLALGLAACGGAQQADGTAAQSPAAGEMPQAGDTGSVYGSPETNTLGNDTLTPGATTGDAGAMGADPAMPATGTTDPYQDPTQRTDPTLEGTMPPADSQQDTTTTSPTPPTQ